MYTFRITENKSGGDCMFRSVAAFELETEERHREARDSICQHIQQNWNTYMVEILTQHQDQIEYFKTLVDRGIDEMTAQEKKISLTKYMNYMTKLGNYGTITELIAGGNHFKFNFTVLQEYTDRVDARLFPLNESWRWVYFLFTGDFRHGHWRVIHPKLPTTIIPKFDNYKKKASPKKDIYIIEYDNITKPPHKSAPPDDPKRSSKRKHGNSNQGTLPKRARRISVSTPRGQPGWEGWEKDIADASTGDKFLKVTNAPGVEVATIYPSKYILKLSPGASTPYSKATYNMILRTTPYGNVFFRWTGNRGSTIFTPFCSLPKDQVYSVVNEDEEKDAYIYCHIQD